MLSDLQHVPRIMRAKGWLNGARLLEAWFSRPQAVAPHYGNPDTGTIRMDAWLLTFPRAKALYDKLMADRIWANPAAQQSISNMLRQQGLATGATRSFGALNTSVVTQDRSYVNFRPSSETTTFDDVTAALGAFALRVLVAGTVAPTTRGGAKGHEVTITEIGVYVRDSFDFEGDQYLGCWSDNPDGFLPLMPPEPPSFRPPMFSPVGNRDFREWRRRTGRGDDFLVYSDLKRTVLTTPDRFSLR